MPALASAQPIGSRSRAAQLTRRLQRSLAVSAHRAVRALREQHRPARRLQQAARRLQPPSASLVGALLEEVDVRQPVQPNASLYNSDFAPAVVRTFSAADIACLWVGLVVCVPTWSLVGSLLELGFSAAQGLVLVGTANVIVLAPMVLNAHAATKYGLPSPVLARSAFGVYGACVPSLLRALVACGWFGLQTWVGATAIHSIAAGMLGDALPKAVIPWLGISGPEAACFVAFWTLQVAIIWRGIECIKLLEAVSAPILIVLTLALFCWAMLAVGSFGPLFAAPSSIAPAAFWPAAGAALTANVGFWATLSLNIGDFTRFAPSQAAQMAGQAIGLPFTMVAFSFVALAVTSATAVLFGAPITDPVAVLARIGGFAATGGGLVGLVVATLSTNIAANVVAPANAFVNLLPQRISFRTGGLITAILGAVSCPWRLLSSTDGFIFVWLTGYSALLGPVAGILLCDYWLIRRRRLDVDGLFSASPSGPYFYLHGVNPAAMLALAAGVLPCVPGFCHAAGLLSVAAFWQHIYSAAWFVGLFLAAAVYAGLMRLGGGGCV